MSSSDKNNATENVNYIGPYPLLRVIGIGGMGKVWLSEHPNLLTPVAIKILDNTLAQESDEYVQSFVKEGQIAATLIDPNIVRVLDAGEDKGKYFLVMEYVDGCTAGELMIQRGGRLPYEEVVQLAISMCRALEQAQKKGIIHRDVKPDNILVNRDGLLKLADLGIAKRIYSKDVKREAIGTPNYISPEQVIAPSKTSHRSDIYSLGVSMFQLISGKVPFSAPDVSDLAMMHVNNEPPCLKSLLPELPTALVAVINRMMAKYYGDRYQNYSTLIQDLEVIRDGNAKVEQLDSDTVLFVPIKPAAVPAVAHPVGTPLEGQEAEGVTSPASAVASRRGPGLLIGLLLLLAAVIGAMVLLTR